MLFAFKKILPYVIAFPLIAGCNPFSYGSGSGGLSGGFAGIAADGLSLSADGSKIVLTWSAATNPTGTVHYFIYGDAAFTELLDRTSDTSWTFDDPVPGTTYVFGVRAKDDNGFDTNTNIAVLRVSLNAPDFAGLVSATAVASTKIQLSWVASPSTDVAGYNIYLSRDLVNPIDTTTSTQYFVTGLTPSTAYTFVVRAKNSLGTTEKNVVTKTATTFSYTVPDFSGVVSATTASGSPGKTTVTLTWGRAGGSVTGYQVYASTTSGGQNFSAPLTPQGANTGNPTVGPYVAGVTTTSATVDGLTLGTTYYFVVRAFYWDGSYLYQEGNTIEKTATTLSTDPPATPPTITSISPAAGSTAGGTFVSITGTGFHIGFVDVTIGGSTCVPVVVSSSTSLTCTTTGHAAGAVTVSAENSDESVPVAGTLTNGFTYTTTPAPTVSSISPTSGASTGNTAVTLTGTGFTAGATVAIGGSTCTGVNVVNATSITCTTSSHAQGSTDVVVTNSDTQYGTLGGGFSYVGAPTISSVSPTVGALAGGTTLTILGTNFRASTTINIGGTNCTPVLVVNPTEIRCPTPAHAAGVVSIIVTTLPDGQTASSFNSFTYQGAPSVSAVLPTAGPIAGGSTLSISGTAFASGATVSVGGSVCTSPSVVNSGSMTCTLPAHTPGLVDVIVTNPDNQFGTLTNSFTFQAAPTVTSISPQFGLAAGGTAVHIVGTGFNAGSGVTLGGSICAITGFTTTTIDCTTGSRAAAAVNVVVTNSDSQTGTLVSGYNYTSLVAPTLSSITPAIGTTAGGSQVTILGTGFSNPTVTLGTSGSGYSACTSLNVVSQTELTCYPAAHTSGTVHVRLVNSDTQEVSMNNAYQYITLNHQGWSDVQAVGAKTVSPQAALYLSDASRSIRLNWNAFAVAGTAILSYNIYRATTSGGYNYASPLATGIAAGSPTYTDTDVSLVAGTTYYYIVRAVVTGGIPLPTSQAYSEIKVIMPPDNMALLHRWIVNQETCALMQKSADALNNYRCAFTGPGGDGTYFDIGQSVFVDTYETGCYFTPAPGCADAVNGCVGTGAPGAGVGVVGDVFFDRTSGNCYLKTAAATWKAQSDSSLTTAQRGEMAKNTPGLPPIVFIDQSKAYDTCAANSVVGFSGTKRLLRHQEHIMAAAWANTLSDANISALEGGSDLPGTGNCNTNNANNLVFDNSTTPADYETFPSTTIGGAKMLITGSDSTSACISRYGIQDLSGNVWEWTSDQLGSCSNITNNCSGSSSNLDLNNDDWSTIVFDGTMGPGGSPVTDFAFSAKSYGSNNFLVSLGLPMVSAVASSVDTMIIGTNSGEFNPARFHNNRFWLYPQNANGAPRARGALSGGSYDYGGGRYELYVASSPSNTFRNSGLRCALPAD